ncbi:MAG: NADH-quinone oxidoreductase subunit NuoE [Dehalococcoidia bacterium]|nr:NADH-quinone oxidoreductase subunit NuoE [Dehalococcoidia bacterium]
MSAINEILAKYNPERSSLIPILHEVQTHFGYLVADAMQQTAEYLHLSVSQVYGVATFYSVFRLKPTGRHCITVCCGTACHVKGSGKILREIEEELSVKEGETSADGEYYLQSVACMGSCALAPMVRVDEQVYGRVTPQTVSRFLRSDR